MTQVGIEAVARDIGDAGEEAPVAVATHEQLGARALLQAEDAHRGLEQLFLAGLEQLIARKGFQDVLERLATVPVRGKSGTVHHVVETLANAWDIPGTARVGTRGIQTQEALLGDRLALLVEAENADVVHVAGAMNRCSRIGLGQDQRVDRARLLQLVCGQRTEAARARGDAAITEDAKPGFRQSLEHLLAVLARHFVFAVAKEGEVIVGHPLEERLGLGAVLVADRHRPLIEPVNDALQLALHFCPVTDTGAHILQRREDAVLDALELARLGLAVDFQVHERLLVALAPGQHHATRIAMHLDHRMDHGVQLYAVLRDGHADGVDQERHVVVDDLHHGMAAVPAVALFGIEQADARRPRLALACEVQQTADDRSPGFSRSRLQIVVGRPLEEGVGQCSRLLVAWRRQAGLEGGKDVFGCGRVRSGRSGLGAHRRRCLDI